MRKTTKLKRKIKKIKDNIKDKTDKIIKLQEGKLIEITDGRK